MLVSSVIGPAKGPCQIFRASGKLLSVEVSAHETMTTSPKLEATALIDVDPPMNRGTARFETSVTGNVKDPSHLL